ncbi:MAG: DUF6125 family protein [Peptococcaceae bacterium]|nr:DUF6125 family protein [Peptococcaceae bacterium]
MRISGKDIVKQFTKEELEELVIDMSKRWLAHDGIWFLSTENARGLKEAIERDGEAWDGFAKAEASRIMKLHNIPKGGGLPALEKALTLRAYSFLNTIEVVESSESRLVFKMVSCRVQGVRRFKGLPTFECKPVGMLEFNSFAITVDPRIKTRCLVCRPDPEVDDDELNCMWEFTI